MIRNRHSRSAFTLVEMMVAMALALGIMLILTESFKMALDFVRGANSTGEMISQLNGAGILLSRDLRAEHFMPDSTRPFPVVKLGDQRLDWFGNAAPKDWVAPIGGFFRIVAPDPGVDPAVPLGDAQGFKINAPATNHQLHFTSVLPNAGDASLYSSVSGGSVPGSRAAEIAYFLAPMNKSTSVGAGGQPLFNLIRRQRILALTTTEKAGLDQVIAAGLSGADPNVLEVVSGVGSNANTMASVMNPANRMTLAQLPGPTPGPASPRYGEDIVVSNVLSFEIQVDWTPHATLAGSNTGPRAFATNTDWPYDSLTQGGGVFDTGAAVPPQYVQIKSLQIVIRVYDPRLKAARQNTWKFAM